MSPTLPPPPPPTFCRHSLKRLSPTLPKLMNWILLSPPPLSSDPDNPPKFGTCTLGVLSEHSGFNHFPYSILNYENKLLDMKHSSHSRHISYNVTSRISYFKCQRINHAAFKFLILRHDWFETHRIFRTSHIYVNKVLLGFHLLDYQNYRVLSS